MEKKLAIFDSGIGGLSLLFHLKSIDDIPVTYLADNSHFPYGSKTDDALIEIVERNIAYLKVNHSDIIIACNTASMIYDKYLKGKYDGVYPIIEHTIETVINEPGIHKVGIIGTKQTIASQVYQNALWHRCHLETTAKACTELVTYSEDLDCEQEITNYMNDYFGVFKTEGVDTFVLSCTHFNRLKPQIEAYFENKVSVIPSGYALVDRLLHENKFENSENIVYLTKNEPQYLKKLIKFIKMNHNFEI